MVDVSLLSAQELARTFNDQAPSDPADEVAKRAVSSLGDMAARLVAIELMAREVEQVRRGEVRVIERGATTVALARAGTRAEMRRQRVEALTAVVIGVRLDLSPKFLASTFAVDGVHVTWGDATVEQHAKRIEMLATQAAGLQDTIARHQEAVRLIEKRHARNLSREIAKREVRKAASLKANQARWGHTTKEERDSIMQEVRAHRG